MNAARPDVVLMRLRRRLLEQQPEQTALAIAAACAGIGRLTSVRWMPSGEVSFGQSHVTVDRYGVVGDRRSKPRVATGKSDLLHGALLGLPPTTQRANDGQMVLTAEEDARAIGKAMRLPDGVLPMGLHGENLVVQGFPGRLMPGMKVVFLDDNERVLPVTLLVTGYATTSGAAMDARIKGYFAAQGQPDFAPRQKYEHVSGGRTAVTLMVLTPPKQPITLRPGYYLMAFASL